MREDMKRSNQQIGRLEGTKVGELEKWKNPVRVPSIRRCIVKTKEESLLSQISEVLPNH